MFGLLKRVEINGCLEVIKEELALHHSVLKNADIFSKLRANWVKANIYGGITITSVEFYGESIRTQRAMNEECLRNRPE